MKKDSAAKYWSWVNSDGSIEKHEIHVNDRDLGGRCFFTLVAHELVHAAIAENVAKRFTESEPDHGLTFVYWSNALKYYLTNDKYWTSDLRLKGEIFDREIDV